MALQPGSEVTCDDCSAGSARYRDPAPGLDPIGRANVWDRIADVRASTGMTVLVTTHYMEEADQHCDRIALMHRGRIRAPTPRIALVTGKAFAAAIRALVQALVVLALAALLGVGLTANPLKLLATALYPVDLMPGWLRAFNHVNPLGYEVDALRGLLIGVPAQPGLDFAVLIAASAVMISIASALLGRLAR
jgi:energy-coupling factor transporter ATP-binding protein EcfA2